MRLRGAIVLLSCFLLASCAGNQAYITQDELLSSIDEGRAPVIIDVRSVREYQAGHIPGAIQISFYSGSSRYSQIDAQKDEPIIVYCGHGPRAGMARFSIQRAGFERVLYLKGHMSAWQERDLPIEK